MSEDLENKEKVGFGLEHKFRAPKEKGRPRGDKPEPFMDEGFCREDGKTAYLAGWNKARQRNQLLERDLYEDTLKAEIEELNKTINELKRSIDEISGRNAKLSKQLREIDIRLASGDGPRLDEDERPKLDDVGGGQSVDAPVGGSNRIPAVVR